LLNGIASKGQVAVGFVIDQATKKHGPEENEADLDVVLAVGINYGQGHAYLTRGVSLLDHTGMIPRLEQAFRVIRESCAGDLPDRSGYHLVAFNVFPWITTDSWSALDFNSIEEALFIKCFAKADMVAPITEFVEKTFGSGISQRRLRAIIFHGADNAVPYFGSHWLDSLLALVRDHLDKSCEVVFCDNLAYGAGISNSAHLCHDLPSKSNLAACAGIDEC
jgi:hypothetical protein